MYDLKGVFELLRQIRIVLEDFDDPDMLVRANVFLLDPQDGPVQQDLIKLRTAVINLIDALATRMRPPQTEALISIFDDRFKGRVLRGVRYIPSGLWEELEADTRLICTRIALRILAEPIDPREDEKKFPTSDWPEAWYRHSRIKGLAERVFARNPRPFVSGGDRAAESNGVGVGRALTSLASGSAAALDLRRCGRRIQRMRLLSFGTPKSGLEAVAQALSASRTIGVSQSQGWSQKIAKSRNAVATRNGPAATRRNRSR